MVKEEIKQLETENQNSEQEVKRLTTEKEKLKGQIETLKEVN